MAPFIAPVLQVQQADKQGGEEGGEVGRVESVRGGGEDSSYHPPLVRKRERKGGRSRQEGEIVIALTGDQKLPLKYKDTTSGR